ncbi:nitrogen fixation protein NifZ [Nitrincola iocasae]|uniref:Nitrogen fixation protein NifZ n=1 Tax=Nitrincola iocasae TaxID=2614693 RepID=A0A5J6L8W0_9GAMM|nr:nitrogen fixation protein NifZ [Nitrincola iocasae]QEW05079.1 nitrogen fixation protein NifZ [Nitrincola iocasae]
MIPVYSYGDEVRVIRNLRNDGSFPGVDKGQLLVRRGETGHVRNLGTFLQDQIIYTVHFIQADIQVGCREEELIPASASWINSRFENRDRVVAAQALSLRGEVIVPLDTPGEVFKVIRHEDAVHYHVQFPGHLLIVPESALDSLDPEEALSHAS